MSICYIPKDNFSLVIVLKVFFNLWEYVFYVLNEALPIYTNDFQYMLNKYIGADSLLQIRYDYSKFNIFKLNWHVNNKTYLILKLPYCTYSFVINMKSTQLKTD